MTEVDELLHAGDRILGDPELSSAIWLRAASLVYRAALEEALDSFWMARAPGVQTASGRSQMACLPEYVGRPLARGLSNAWGELSNMAHHRTDLGPDPLAVRRAGETVRRLLLQLEKCT